MKRIVICCDGTWNRLDAPYPTNVARLARAMLSTDPKTGVVQTVLHLDGVGAGRGTGSIAQSIDRLFGGAFGWGLSGRIAEAYTHLVLNYEPGDEIYIFGYSRGAYTARSLAGMIRNCGILERRHVGKVAEAMTLYRTPRVPGKVPEKPDDDESLLFRAEWATHVTTGADELAWRRRNGRPDRTPEPVALGVHFIGVWDTVGALGIPEGFTLSNWVNRPYQFHDTKLSSTVRAARHAVAIDERRATFPVTPWVNLPDFATGVHLEQWLPGNHGSVGGGGDVTGLSSGALVWVLEGAIAQGLAVDAGMLAAWEAEADFLAPLSADSRPRPRLAGFVLSARQVDREGPGGVAGVAWPARRRWRAGPDYRPAPLRRLAEHLDADDDASLPLQRAPAA